MKDKMLALLDESRLVISRAVKNIRLKTQNQRQTQNNPNSEFQIPLFSACPNAPIRLFSQPPPSPFSSVTVLVFAGAVLVVTVKVLFVDAFRSLSVRDHRQRLIGILLPSLSEHFAYWVAGLLRFSSSLFFLPS
ncbi:hypothetical protein PIB30_065335 [Stylosanthes scabra]|uniref:Uncharacterized protein n=1 Tax=Stylosanthes scabra TaxID=79078 RepID=A0ABU6RMS7_9FABA|nr:hypothetical protein [Stylosanthes scabra]